MVLENHFWAIIIITVNSGRKQQRTLKLVNKHGVRNRILHGLEVYVHKVFITPYF